MSTEHPVSAAFENSLRFDRNHVRLSAIQAGGAYVVAKSGYRAVRLFIGWQYGTGYVWTEPVPTESGLVNQLPRGVVLFHDHESADRVARRYRGDKEAWVVHVNWITETRVSTILTPVRDDTRSALCGEELARD